MVYKGISNVLANALCHTTLRNFRATVRNFFRPHIFAEFREAYCRLYNFISILLYPSLGRLAVKVIGVDHMDTQSNYLLFLARLMSFQLVWVKVCGDFCRPKSQTWQSCLMSVSTLKGENRYWMRTMLESHSVGRQFKFQLKPLSSRGITHKKKVKVNGFETDTWHFLAFLEPQVVMDQKVKQKNQLMVMWHCHKTSQVEAISSLRKVQWNLQRYQIDTIESE